MRTQEAVSAAARAGELDAALAALYGTEGVTSGAERLATLAERHAARFGARGVAAFSAPGRVELGGNHTDHQRGLVLAAAVSADILAVASPNDKDVVRIVSEGFPDTVIAVSYTHLDVYKRQALRFSLVRRLDGILRDARAAAGHARLSLAGTFGGARGQSAYGVGGGEYAPDLCTPCLLYTSRCV